MHRKYLIFTVLTGVVLLMSTAANAQPRADVSELNVSGSYFRPLGTGSGALNLGAAYGYFLTDRFQGGLRQSLTVNHNRDASDTWNAVTAPFLNYHFEEMSFGSRVPLVPFLGTFVGAVWNDEDFTGTVGPQAGLKAYLTDSTFFVTDYRYEWFFEELGDANETQDANHVVGMGFGYQWD